jgi:hypothetical protein
MSDKPFNCKLCPSAFSQFYTYKRHMNTKHLAIQDDNAKDAQLIEYRAKQERLDAELVQCDLCEKRFSNKYNLKRHKDKSCNPSPEVLLKTLKSETAASILAVLIKSGCLGGNSNNNNNNKTINAGSCTMNNDNRTQNNDNRTLNLTNNNNNQTINIHPLGKENLDHITKERKIKILCKGLKAVSELYDAILELPENWNVAITDKRNSKVTYKNRDGKIEIASLDKVLGMITTDNIDRIDEYLDELYNELPLHDKTIIRLMEAQEFTIPGNEPTGRTLLDTPDFDTYHNKCMEHINNILNLKKKKLVCGLNRYIETFE